MTKWGSKYTPLKHVDKQRKTRDRFRTMPPTNTPEDKANRDLKIPPKCPELFTQRFRKDDFQKGQKGKKIDKIIINNKITYMDGYLLLTERTDTIILFLAEARSGISDHLHPILVFLKMNLGNVSMPREHTNLSGGEVF